MARVLIIDDDPTVPVLLKSFLAEKRRDEVLLIDDATQALRSADDCQPDVILIASSVSGVDALTVASQLQAHRSVPVVLYGVTAPHSEERDAALATVVTYLPSPISTDELLAARDVAVEHTI